MLFRAQMHGIGEVIADIQRHPDIGLTRGQGTARFVLCPESLIDSFRLGAQPPSHDKRTRTMPFENKHEEEGPVN
jgi:hypothetical protein